MMDRLVNVDIEGQATGGKMAGSNLHLMADANDNLKDLPMGKNVSDAKSMGGGAVDAAKGSDEFFLKMGSLVALVSTCMNTSNSMMNAYELDHWQMALANAILLGVLQAPTTLVIFYKFLKSWIKKKLLAFRKAMTDIKIMEELHSKKDAHTGSARPDMKSGSSPAFPNYQSANGAMNHVTEPTIIQSQAEPLHARKTEENALKASRHGGSNSKDKNGTTLPEKDIIKRSKKEKLKSRKNKSAKRDRSKSPKSNGRELVTKMKEMKGMPGVPDKKVSKTCQCACFPLALIRSKSMPDVSSKRISLPQPEVDLNLREIEDVSGNAGNPLDAVTGNKKVKSGRKFPWKRRQAGRMSLDDPLQQDNVLSLEEGARNQLKSKADLASQRNKSFCLPVLCHRRNLSLISNDFDTNVGSEIDDLQNRQTRRLPTVPRDISSLAADANLATLRTDDVVEEFQEPPSSYKRIRPALGYTERGNLLSQDNVFPNG